jgi:hypothetical protein
LTSAGSSLLVDEDNPVPWEFRLRSSCGTFRSTRRA